MLRDFISHIGPYLGVCDHPIRLAELLLLAIICVVAGCCCGGLLTALALSPWIRGVLAKILLHLLEPERFGVVVGGRSGQDRLQPYRA